MQNTRIQELAKEQQSYMVKIRRDIHRNPEPSREEYRTQKLIIDELKKMGIEEVEKYFNTGVAAVIRGGSPGKTIGLRADMDALLMEETSGLPFSSEVPGVAHACGHDGHTAILLATGKVLNQIKEDLVGNVKLIFQPAEEDGPRGGGAQYMIKEGVLTDEPSVDFMVGLHLNNSYQVGKLICKDGVVMAGSDPFYLDIYGVGGHASQPHLIKDPIVAAAYIIASLQTVVARNVNPFESSVIGVSMIEGGTRHNIVPEKVHLRGTIRSFKEETRTLVGERITSIVNNVAEAMGVKAELDIRWNYKPTMNDPEMYKDVKFWFEDIIGKENYVEQELPRTGGEDFSYFASAVPSIYFWVGSQAEDGNVKLAHSPDFTFNEDAMQYGVMAFTRIVLGYLNNL